MVGAEAPTADEIDSPHCTEWITGEPMELDFSPEVGELTEGGETYDGFSYDAAVNSPYEDE